MVIARVVASSVPPLFMVIPATVVVATRVTVSPLFIVIESVICGVVLLQFVQVVALLKAPPPVPLVEHEKAACTFEVVNEIKKGTSKRIVRRKRMFENLFFG